MLRDNLKSVVIKSKEGKTERSNGFFIYIVRSKITTESEIFVAKKTSNKEGGRGIMIIPNIPTTPTAIKRSF